MDPINSQFLKLVIFTTSVFSYCYCHADQNQPPSWECFSFSRTGTVINPYRTNIDNVLNTLSENVHLHDGFYNATSGKGEEKIFGIVQCRAGISPQDCANCTKMSIQEAAHNCPMAGDVTITFSRCFLKYSNNNFFGVWNKSDSVSLAAPEPRFDNSKTVRKGIELMSGLAKAAPDQDLMVQTGKRGKRYGMAQCTKDMSRSNCGECLDVQAMFFENGLGNYSNMEMFDRGCRLWYHDYKFYSKISTTALNGGERSSTANEGVLAGMIFGALVLLSGL